MSSSVALVTGSSGLIGSEAVGVPRRARLDACTASTTTCAATSSARTATPPGTSSGLRERDDALRAPRPRHPRPRSVLRLVGDVRPEPDRACCGPAVARPGGDAAVRRLRRQCRRHAEPARSRAPVAVRRDRRSSSSARTRSTATRRTRSAGRARDALGLRRSRICERHRRDDAASTRRCIQLFGASKLAADVMVQEYGRYFGMPTVCFRGGCLTGPHHSAAELHGFLAYLARATARGPPYRDLRLQGQAGPRQHPALDVCTAIMAFARRRRARRGSTTSAAAASNSVSMLEAIDASRSLYGRKLDWEYVEEPRGATTSATSATSAASARTTPAGSCRFHSTKSSRRSPRMRLALRSSRAECMRQ